MSKEALGIYDLEQVPHIVNSRGAAWRGAACGGGAALQSPCYLDRRGTSWLSMSHCVYDIHFAYAPFSIKNVTYFCYIRNVHLQSC